MFNLLMFNVDWKLRRAKIDVRPRRIFEHTDDYVANQFREDSNPKFDMLKTLPCIFCNEGRGDEDAYVGYISEARLSGYNLYLEIVLDEDVPSFKNSMMYANRIELDIDNFFRNHWAVKNVDLYRFLLRNVRPRRQRPKVFKIPEHEDIVASLASAMMPFDSKFTKVYESICQATDNVGLRCRRADNIWEHPAVIQDVVALIDRSQVVICDCTERNSNVFYEIGIAHTLGREVILITQNEDDVPFDLRHLHYILYDDSDEGLIALTEGLKDRMRTVLGH